MEGSRSELSDPYFGLFQENRVRAQKVFVQYS